MITLQITPAKAAALDAIEDLALEVVKKALRGEIPAEDDQVKVATSTLGLVAKNRQMATNRAAFEYGVAVSTATDEQLAKYIEVTNPEIHKALGKAQTMKAIEPAKTAEQEFRESKVQSAMDRLDAAQDG